VSAKRVERLEKTLARVAREQGLDQERLRRWVSFLALCGVLEHAVEKGVINTYYLKGGVAMELRFAHAARTTKDFDLGLEGNRVERLQRLEEVLKLGFDEFAFRLKPETHQMELADTVRVEVAVAIQNAGLADGRYRSRPRRSAGSGLGQTSRYGASRDGLTNSTARAVPRHQRAGGSKATCLHRTSSRGPRAGCCGHSARGHAGQARLSAGARRGGAGFRGATHSCISSRRQSPNGLATGVGEPGSGAWIPYYECRGD